MTQVRDILTEAHSEIGILGAEETMTSAQATFGLQKLNEVIDEWATQNLTILSITRTTFPIVSGTGTYTVGATGSVVLARPIFVPKVSFIDTTQANNPEFPLDVLDDASYEALTFKAQTGSLPTNYYWQNTYPNATLILWMIPNRSGLTGVIYGKAATAGYVTIADTFDLAPGYRSALVKATALAMCAGYGASPSPLLFKAAGTALGNIKRANYRDAQLSLDPAVTHGRARYDIYTDTLR